MEVVANTDAFNAKIALVIEPFAVDMEDVKEDEGKDKGLGAADRVEVSLLSQLIRKIISWVGLIQRMDSNW